MECQLFAQLVRNLFFTAMKRMTATEIAERGRVQENPNGCHTKMRLLPGPNALQ